MLTRRQAIRNTLVFSSALLTARWAGLARAAQPGADGMHLLALGDFGMGDKHQAAVAAAMTAFARKLNQPLTAVLALGDNFYGKMTLERFVTDFEKMYPAADLPCPFHAVLGNHDYGPGYDANPKQGIVKAQMELDYARDNPQSRWKLPAKWYALELPDAGGNPLVKIVFIDTNYFEEGMLTPQEKLAQKRFLDAELNKPTKAPWLWVAGHHPLLSDGEHGDSVKMMERFTPWLVNHPVSFYLCGHDHTMQHLELPDYKLSFLISGGGGAHLHNIKRAERGYGEKTLGFTYLHVTPERVETQFIDAEGRRLHAFRRSVRGKVEVLGAA